MENGNVVQYLAERAPNTDCVFLVSCIIVFNLGQVCECLVQSLDVAQGLEYLHGVGEGIIHGDIKGVSVIMNAT